MRGLLIKDFMLLKNQLKFYIIFSLLCAFMLFINFNPGYVVGYMTLVFMMFTFTTISYDEFDNGFSFLFTLPVSRKIYVTEKYLFGILVSVTVWGLVFLVVVLESGMTGNLNMTDIFQSAITNFIMIQLFFAVNLPLQLKYGAEKGRLALIGVAVATFAAVFCFAKGVKYFDMNLVEAVNSLEAMGIVSFFGILAVICVIVFAISYFISLRIMEKKQF